MKLNNQEEFIKNKMQSFEPDIDKDVLWNSLEQHIPNKKKRRGFIYIPIASLILSIVLIALFILNRNSIDYENQIPKKEYVNSNNFKNEETNINKTSDNKNKIINKNDDKVLSNSSFKTNTNILKNKSQKLNNPTTKSNQKLKTELQNKLSSQNYQSIKEDNTKNEIVFIENVNKKLNNTSILNKLKLLPIYYKRDLEQIQVNSFSSHFSKKKYLTLSMGFSLGVVKQRYSTKTPESEDYSNYLSSVSMSKPALGLDIGINYNLSKNIYLNSGLKFKRLTTEIHSKVIQIQKEENETPEGLIQRVTKEIEYDAIGYNYHYLLDLPLNVGINIVENKNLKIGLQGGVSFNLFTVSKGKMLDTNYKLYDYNNTTSNHYNNRFSLGWQSSILIDYKMENNLSLYIKPGISQQKIKYNIDNIFINEFYSIFDLNIGLKYRI